jgi:hypothetical protein
MARQRASGTNGPLFESEHVILAHALAALVAALVFASPSMSRTEGSHDQDRCIAYVKSLGGKCRTTGSGQQLSVVEVDLSGTTVRDQDLSRLKSLVELQQLNLSQTRITGGGLVQLRGLRHLSQLFLNNTFLGDANLADVGRLTQLQTLSLGSTLVTDRGLVHLKPLTGLRILRLNGTKVTGVGLKPLIGLKNLENIAIRPSDAGLKELKRFPKLHWLRLAFSPGLTKDGLAELTRMGPLREIELGQGTTDAAMALLPSLPQLRFLSLRGSLVTDAGLEQLGSVQNIETLILGDTAITDNGLKKLKALTKLKSLFINATQVSDAGLEQLRELKSLRAIAIPQRVTQKGVARLKEALPDVLITG